MFCLPCRICQKEGIIDKNVAATLATGVNVQKLQWQCKKLPQKEPVFENLLDIVFFVYIWLARRENEKPFEKELTDGLGALLKGIKNTKEKKMKSKIMKRLCVDVGES